MSGSLDEIQLRRLIDGSTTGQVLTSRTVRRSADVGAQLRISATELGVTEAQTALRAFAVSGATAVALAQSVQHDRLRHSLQAAVAERRRWRAARRERAQLVERCGRSAAASVRT